jgi:signal transduction histidine kinase
MLMAGAWGQSARTLRFETALRAVLPVGALALLVLVAVSAITASETERSLGEASRLQVVRAATNDLLNDVVSAETGQRGYLLTRDPVYLAPYDQAVIHAPARLDTVTRLGAATAVAPADLAEFRGVLEAKFAELANTVALARAGRFDDALAVVRTNEGRNLMGRVRALASRIADAQRARLQQDLTRGRRGAERVLAVNVAAAAFLLLTAGLLVIVAGRDLARLRQARASLQLANEALERSAAGLDRAVRERTAELTAANEEVQRFAYIVSHDLRAPLLNIIGFTSELQVALEKLRHFVTERVEAGDPVPDPVREATDDDLPEAIRFIQSSAARMDRLITAILKLSREGRRVLTPEPLDMAALLGAAVDAVRHAADARGATVTLGETPPIVGDRLAVEQIFANLIENAVKYLAPGRPGQVRIQGRQEGAEVVYTVQDNGRGIDPRDHERIFDLFRRAGLQDTQGEGIGLAHVRALVRRLGGTIDCQSALDMGSTFTVRLPSSLAYASGT